ncbi:MAG: hypothetical protein AABX04_02460, partial [Nanoarchaeota archaeon]
MLQTDLETILAEFDDKDAKINIIRVALDKGISVNPALIQWAIDTLITTKKDYLVEEAAKLAEKAGDLQQAHKLYSQASINAENRQDFRVAFTLAAKIQDMPRAWVLYQKFVHENVGNFSASIEDLGDLAIPLGKYFLVKSLYEKAIKEHSRKKEYSYAANIALKLGDLPRAIDLFCKQKSYCFAGKIAELQDDAKKAEKFYRRQIKFLQRKGYDTSLQVELAKKVGDFELALEIELSDHQFAEAAEIARAKGENKRAREILDFGMEYYRKQAEDNLHIIEKGIAQLKRQHLLHQLKGMIEKPEVQSNDLLQLELYRRFICEQEEIPRYETVADLLCQAAELAERKNEDTRAAQFYAK